MKHGSFHLQLAILLAHGFFLSTLSAWSFSGAGDGTEISPYIITDVTQLQEMNLDLSAHYVLGNDIDASETEEWNGGDGFEPIGNATTTFTGFLDGRGRTVTGLSINRRSAGNLGLFAVVAGATVRNLKLDDVSITGKGGVGGLAGGCGSSLLDNCHVIGTVSGTYVIGGLVGGSGGSEILNCSASGEVVFVDESEDPEDFVVTGYMIGGLVGNNSNTSKIMNSFANVNVSGNILVGGLVGENGAGLNGSGSVVSQCYATGRVNGLGSFVGGLVGRTFVGEVSHSYATGPVTGFTAVGGLVGWNSVVGSHVESCYATGVVSGVSEVGGLIGENEGTHDGSYWDTLASRTISGVGNEEPDEPGIAGKTTAEMHQQATFENWEFETIWWIDEGNDYPRLRWEHGMTPDLFRMIQGFREGRETGKSFLDFVSHWKRGR